MAHIIKIHVEIDGTIHSFSTKNNSVDILDKLKLFLVRHFQELPDKEIGFILGKHLSYIRQKRKDIFELEQDHGANYFNTSGVFRNSDWHWSTTNRVEHGEDFLE